MEEFCDCLYGARCWIQSLSGLCPQEWFNWNASLAQLATLVLDSFNIPLAVIFSFSFCFSHGLLLYYFNLCGLYLVSFSMYPAIVEFLIKCCCLYKKKTKAYYITSKHPVREIDANPSNKMLSCIMTSKDRPKGG